MTRVLYGIARGPLPAVQAAGVDAATVEQVAERDLVGLVSDAPDELLARRRDVTAHMDVLDEVMRHGPVLPFRFGTVVDDDAAVRAMLADRFDDLAGQLDELDGTVQVTLRVTQDEDAAVHDAVRADRRLQRLVESSRRRKGSLSDQVLLGEEIAAAVSARAEAVRADTVDRLSRHVLAIAANDDAAALLSVAMLVERRRLSELDDLVEQLAAELGDAVTVDYAGPMPAYSFVR